MSDSEESRQAFRQKLADLGRTLGFDLIRVTAAVTPPGYHPLLQWMADGYAADMDWMARRQDAYQHPDGVLPGTRSIVVVAMNYHNEGKQADGDVPRIARYAWGRQDYHKVLRRQLKKLARLMQDHSPQHQEH